MGSSAEKGQAGTYRMGKGFFNRIWIDLCKVWVLLVSVAILVWVCAALLALPTES